MWRGVLACPCACPWHTGCGPTRHAGLPAPAAQADRESREASRQSRAVRAALTYQYRTHTNHYRLAVRWPCSRSKSVMSAASVGLASVRMKRFASSRRKPKSVSPPRPPPVTKLAAVTEAPASAASQSSPGRGSLSALLNMDVFGDDDEVAAPGTPPLIRHGVRNKFESSGGTRMSNRRKESRMLVDSKKRVKCVMRG